MPEGEGSKEMLVERKEEQLKEEHGEPLQKSISTTSHVRIMAEDRDIKLTQRASIFEKDVKTIMREKTNSLRESLQLLEQEYIFSDDSDSSTEEEIEYRRDSHRPSIQHRDMFLDELIAVPSLSDMSLAISRVDLSAISLREKPSRGDRADIGSFVDPLTGEEIDDEEETIGKQLTDVSVEEEDEDETDEMSQDSELVFSDEEVTKPFVEKGSFIQDFFQDRFYRVQIDEEPFDEEAFLKEQEHMLLVNITTDFITSVINTVVGTLAYQDTKTKLRNSLDKALLVNDISKKQSEREEELFYNKLITRKVYDYFRRKRNYRALEPDTVHTFSTDFTRYRQALAQLDQVINIQMMTKDILDTQLEVLNVKKNQLMKIHDDVISEFDNLMRRTFNVMNNPTSKISMLVENALKNMAIFRERICQTRFLLINRQHTFGLLMQKIEKMEDLGNGLSMRDFENTSIEVLKIQKKLEERSYELNRMHSRFRKSVHNLAHTHEKVQIERSMLSILKDAYKKFVELRIVYKQKLFELKKDRSSIHRAQTEASFQAGLLDKPTLMHDYDDTCIALQKQKDINEQLKFKIAKLYTHFVYFENLSKGGISKLRPDSIKMLEEVVNEIHNKT